MKSKQIYARNGNLVIEVPLKTHRANPWNDKYAPEMDNIIGLVESDLDKGFCFRIDMEYKGKDDQWTDYFFKFDGEIKEFEKLCKELGIDCVFDMKEATDESQK